MGWFYTITEEMMDLGLVGNDLMVFAIIHNFTQEKEGCYYGSTSTLAARCGIARETAIRILKRLVNSGYIIKSEIFRNGVKFCSYETSDKLSLGVTNNHTPGDESSHKNKSENKDIILSNNARTKKKNLPFVAPSVQEVADYCAERGNTVDAEAFVSYYESNGWKVGRVPMKDWRAAVRTWEKREESRPVKEYGGGSKYESPFEHNIRVIDQMTGGDLHSLYYPGKK